MGMQMRKKDMTVAVFAARHQESSSEMHPAAQAGSAQIGTIAGVNTDGALTVEFPGAAYGPTPARLAVALTAEGIQTAIASRLYGDRKSVV